MIQKYIGYQLMELFNTKEFLHCFEIMISKTLNQNPAHFDEYEEKIQRLFQAGACLFFKMILESYDDWILKNRDPSVYRNKGKRTNCLKTVFGPVEYTRRIYQTDQQFVFLLDQSLKITKIGSFSKKATQVLLSEAADKSFRKSAHTSDRAIGLPVSHQAIWNLKERFGQSVMQKEKIQQKSGIYEPGSVEATVLFEEVDGVYLSLQREVSPSKELKVSTCYTGWSEQGKDQFFLQNKLSFAEFTDSMDFHEKREYAIHSHYNMDTNKARILNTDGAKWCTDVPYKPTVIQLDRFHIMRSIHQNIYHKKMRSWLLELLYKEQPEDLLDVLDTYINSISYMDEWVAKARETKQYLENHIDQLKSYKTLIDPDLLEADKVYRGMGIQESNNFNLITRRMKHQRMSWRKRSGNHMVKLLCSIQNGTLEDDINCCFSFVRNEKRLNHIKKNHPKRKKLKSIGTAKGHIYAGHAIRKLNKSIQNRSILD